MNVDADKLTEAEKFRFDRRTLDGVSIDWLAERTQLTAEQVRDAWEACRHSLSRHLADDNEALLSDEYIHANTEQCLRLLLQWQEVLELQVSFGEVQETDPDAE